MPQQSSSLVCTATGTRQAAAPTCIAGYLGVPDPNAGAFRTELRGPIPDPSESTRARDSRDTPPACPCRFVPLAAFEPSVGSVGVAQSQLPPWTEPFPDRPVAMPFVGPSVLPQQRPTPGHRCTWIASLEGSTKTSCQRPLSIELAVPGSPARERLRPRFGRCHFSFQSGDNPSLWRKTPAKIGASTMLSAIFVVKNYYSFVQTEPFVNENGDCSL